MDPFKLFFTYCSEIEWRNASQGRSLFRSLPYCLNYADDALIVRLRKRRKNKDLMFSSCSPLFLEQKTWRRMEACGVGGAACPPKKMTTHSWTICGRRVTQTGPANANLPAIYVRFFHSLSLSFLFVVAVDLFGLLLLRACVKRGGEILFFFITAAAGGTVVTFNSLLPFYNWPGPYSFTVRMFTAVA